MRYLQHSAYDSAPALMHAWVPVVPQVLARVRAPTRRGNDGSSPSASLPARCPALGTLPVLLLVLPAKPSILSSFRLHAPILEIVGVLLAPPRHSQPQQPLV